MYLFTWLSSVLFLATASAGELKLFELSQYELWGGASVRAYFQVNPDLGRAWVEYAISNGESGTDEYRVKVPGMRLDVQSGHVLLEHEGQEVACAQLVEKGRGIFRQTFIKENKRCHFEERKKTIHYDNGFEMKKTVKHVFFLVID